MNENDSNCEETNGSIRLDTFPDFLAAVIQPVEILGAEKAWWRGQSDASWNLTPGIYREDRARLESTFCNRFKIGAPVRHSKVPAQNDIASWLFLAQHYRLPTRMMDWTKSPLYALYFAIKESDETDGALWALCVPKLNKSQTGYYGEITAESPNIMAIIAAAFTGKNTQESKEGLIYSRIQYNSFTRLK